jgi:tetratricopeptide (TPR) repeat protein
LTRSGQQELAALGATSKFTLEAPPGEHQLKAVVRESVEATLGSVQEWIVLARRLAAGKPSGPKYRLLAALAAPHPSAAIPLSFSTYTFYTDPKQALVRFSAEARLPENGAPGASMTEPLQILGMALREDGEIASLFGSSAGADDSGGKVAFGGRMKLPPGRYRLKLAVADIGGRVGTAEQDLFIPELPEDRLATSSLVAARELQTFPPSVFAVQVKLTDELDPFIHQGLQIRPPASRRFNRGEPLIVFYRLYNLAAEDGQSPLMARVSLVGESGGSKEFPPVVLNEGVEAATRGEAGVAFQLPTGDLAPGKYSLNVETRNVSGSRSVLTRLENIEVLPGKGKAVASSLEGNGSPVGAPGLDLPEPGEKGVQEEIDLLAIAGAEDPAQRVGLIEAFLTRHPESDRVGELRRQATWLYWRLNQFQKAIQHGEASLSDSPSDPQVLTILATAYHALDEPAQAIRRASRAVRSLRSLERPGHMDPQRWQSRIDDLMSQNYAYMGSAYLSQYEADRRNPASQNAGLNLQKAHLYSTRAVELAPRSDFAQFQLGIVFCARNDVVAAIQPLAKAVVLNGRFGDIARENLESVYRLIHQGSLDGLENLLAQARLDLANGKRSSL